MDDARDEARRWVRRKRNFYRIVVIYLVLCVLWFAIDMLTGTDDLWFYWPMLGAGLIVAVIGIAMFGIDGLFGSDWERRQVHEYVQRQRLREKDQP
jgi:two-component system, LytTR family, sensor kinase